MLIIYTEYRLNTAYVNVNIFPTELSKWRVEYQYS